MYEILYSQTAIEDIEKLKKSGEMNTLKKLAALIDELQEHPQTGTGQPEQLKYNFTGYWSRRLSQKHRLVYQIEEEQVIVKIVSARGHYSK